MISRDTLKQLCDLCLAIEISTLPVEESGNRCYWSEGFMN